MLKIVHEGQLVNNYKSDALLTAGQLVKITAEGKIAAAGAGEDVFGIVAQDVVDPTVNNFKLNSVTHDAGVSVDQVGVYTNGGVYKTDQFLGTVTAGAKLYAGAGGKLTATASGNAVAVSESAATAGAGVVIRFKSLIG
jgi:hypothetical protein